MKKIFCGPLATVLLGFLQFKRDLGYGYRRAEFTLREFDKFLIKYEAKNRHWRLDRAAISWLSSKPGRKPVSVSNEAAILRQLFRYLRRSSAFGTVVEPVWPHLPTASQFIPSFLSKRDILNLLALCADLDRPQFRAVLYRGNCDASAFEPSKEPTDSDHNCWTKMSSAAEPAAQAVVVPQDEGVFGKE